MGWAGLVVVPATGLAFGVRAAAGVACGMLWAVGNVWLLNAAVSSTFGHPRAHWLTRAGLWVLKVPIWYAVGGVFVVSPWSSPVGFLVGFSLWLGLITLNAVRQATLS